MKRILGVSLLVSATAFLLAARAHFSPVSPMQPNIPNGGRAVAIAVDPGSDNNIVVASESGGLFRSTSRGATWSQVSGNGTFWFTDVTYLPANRSVVIATANADTRVTSGGGIWRSADGGGSWSRVSVSAPTADCTTNFAAYALAAETGRDRVWAGTLCGLAYSDDEGLSWTFLPVVSGYGNDPVYAVLAPAVGRLDIVTPFGMKLSTDGGSTWSTPSSGLPPYYNIQIGSHSQIASAPTDPDHLWWAFNYWFYNGTGYENHRALFRSTDNGATWTSATEANVVQNRPPFVRAALAPAFGSSQYAVYFSDGGCTFERADATFGSSSTLSSWTTLNVDHCDYNDMAFADDDTTPLLLATDGGLHGTSDDGLNWHFTGGGANGYDALQITEVTGQQHSGDSNDDLYFGTQDNAVWASPDFGATWPAAASGEGFFLNVWRDALPPADTTFTYVGCGPCGNVMSGPVLSGVTGWPDPPNNAGNPRLLSPGNYVQNTALSGLTASIFDLTTNTGGSWTPRYAFPEQVQDLPKVAGDESNPVVYTAIQVPGTTPTGDPLIQIKRVTDVLGSSTPLVSNISGFGGLGIFPTMFAWYKPFGVAPGDPNYLIVSDIIDHQVKVSTDAGASWNPDLPLTNLVTGSGTFKFNWGPFTQTSTFALDPDCASHIVVGTRQAGAFESFNRGGSWTPIAGSDQLPDISSVFFAGGGREILSSYGRGLWETDYTCPLAHLPPGAVIKIAEPLIYWKGAKVPISQIHDPEVCPVCGYYLDFGGKVIDYRTAPGSDQLQEVFVTGGSRIEGFTFDGKSLPVQFKVTIGQRQGHQNVDPHLQQLLGGGNQIKGLFMEGATLRGLIISSQDLTLDQLPKTVPLGPHIRAALNTDAANGTSLVTVSGAGFNPQFPIQAFLDGQPAKIQSVQMDAAGNFEFTLPGTLGVGGHTVRVTQDTPNGLIQDANIIVVSVADDGK